MATISHADLEALWVAAGGSPQTADVAAAIAQAESGAHPSAIANTAYPSLPGYHPVAPGNLPEYSVGLWQINLLAHTSYTATQMLTPRLNAVAAVAISKGGSDFGAWSTYKSGAYKNYLQSGGTPTPQAGTVAGLSTSYVAPSAHAGYIDLRNSLARHVPTQLQRSTMTGARTLRLLRRKSKVKN